jgi:hypothetical protein
MDRLRPGESFLPDIDFYRSPGLPVALKPFASNDSPLRTCNAQSPPDNGFARRIGAATAPRNE